MGSSTIQYTILGEPSSERETIVLIHGIGHRRQAWATVPQRLVDAGYCVVALDLPGHGTSPAPVKPYSYSMSSSTDQLEEFFAGLGLEKPHVVGNSLGGQMVLELASRGTVASATAISPAGFFTPAEIGVVGVSLLLMKAGAHAPKKITRVFADREALRKLAMRQLYVHPERLTPDEAYEDTLNLRSSVGFWPYFVRGTRLKYIGSPLVPTTVAWGDKDRLLLPRQAKRAAQALPEATHVTLPDCGHCAMLDDPELVVQVIEATVERGIAARGGSGDLPDSDLPREGALDVDA